MKLMLFVIWALFAYSSLASEPVRSPAIWFVDLATTGEQYTSAQIALLNSEVEAKQSEPDRLGLLVFIVPRLSSLRIVFIDVDSRYAADRAAEIRQKVSEEVKTMLRRFPKHARVQMYGLPNQALEPTTTAVTPRADARVAPAVVVAHL